jgi:citrate lyase subunit beta/citryl-CoA lyase
MLEVRNVGYNYGHKLFKKEVKVKKVYLEFQLHKKKFCLSENTYKYLKEYCCDCNFKAEFKRRSHLFVPLNKPRFLEKVGQNEVPADGFIWDLEDSIPNGQKQVARDSIAKIPPKPRIVEYNIRINVGDPQELEKDIKAIAEFPKKFDSITLPKGESGADVAKLIGKIGEDKNYIVTIETIAGLNAIDEIARVLRKDRDGLGFGVGDMSTDFGVERISTVDSPLFQKILGMITLTGKKYGLALFDSVSAKFNDPENSRKEAELSCHIFGFTGKKCINPKQLESINSVFSPTTDKIKEHLETLESFLGTTNTNAHVVADQYKGMPAFKASDRQMKRYLRQGYLKLTEL